MYPQRSNKAPPLSWDAQQDEVSLTTNDRFHDFSVPPNADHIGSLQLLVEDVDQVHVCTRLSQSRAQ